MRKPSEHVIAISELRDSLSLAYHHVKNADEAISVQRYRQQDVAMVPLWEWRFLNDIEAGEKPWEGVP